MISVPICVRRDLPAGMDFYPFPSTSMVGCLGLMQERSEIDVANSSCAFQMWEMGAQSAQLFPGLGLEAPLRLAIGVSLSVNGNTFPIRQHGPSDCQPT